MNPNLGRILAQSGADPTQLDMSGGQNLPGQQTPGAGNPLLNFILPAAGGVLGGIAGEALGPLGAVGGAGLGQGAGQFISDLIQGRTPGNDVVGQGVGGLIGGGVGAVGGKLLGGLLGKTGEDLAAGGLNLTQLAKNKLAQANGESVATTLASAGLHGVDAAGLQKGIKTLNDSFDSIANSTDVPIDPNILLQNASDGIAKLTNSNVPTRQALAKQVDEAMSGILDKVQSGQVTTLKDLNAIRDEFDSATPETQFGSAEHGINRITGSILRKSVQDTADAAGLTGPNGESLSELGKKMNKLINISDIAQNREGMGGGGSLMSVTNLLLGGEGAGAAAAAGINPLIGGAVAVGARKALSSPVVARILSQGATRGGQALAGNGVGLGIAGAIGGGQLGAALSGVGGGPQENGQNNTQENQPVQSGESVPQQQQGVQADENGNYQLPSLLQANTQIPGQFYPVELQAQDLQKVGKLPFYMQDAAINAIRAKAQANDQVVQQYMATHQLQPAEINFMQSAGQQNEMMNTLRTLINQKGNSDVFQAVLNDNPAVQAIRAKTDPAYAQMAALMSQLKGASVRAIEGGRPSNFDIQVFNTAPTLGDTKASAMAKLDQLQKFLVDNYSRQLPYYGYTLRTQAGQAQQAQAQATQAPVPANLMSILGLGQAPAQQ